MILVRQVFQAKFGHAAEAAAMMAEGMRGARDLVGMSPRWRVLTDLSGPFDTVVLEVEAESLAQWEEARSRLFSNPHFQEQQRGGRELFVAGRNELYTIEAQG